MKTTEEDLWRAKELTRLLVEIVDDPRVTDQSIMLALCQGLGHLIGTRAPTLESAEQGIAIAVRALREAMRDVFDAKTQAASKLS